jgi:hypothetical protein
MVTGLRERAKLGPGGRAAATRTGSWTHVGGRIHTFQPKTGDHRLGKYPEDWPWPGGICCWPLTWTRIAYSDSAGITSDDLPERDPSESLISARL